MKKRLIIGSLAGLALLFFAIGCKKDDASPAAETSILPSSFNVEVPTSLTGSPTKSGIEAISGNEIYGIMRAFIYVGNESGKITKDLMSSIAKWGIDHPMVVTFTSDDDLRSKSLVVTANQRFENKTFEYKMVITDIASDSIGLEMYWNRMPISGVAILQGHSLNKTNKKDLNAKIRIDYNEAKAGSIYEKEMEITLVGLDTVGVDNNCDNLKMFVGKKGDNIDVFGNANLPDATIIDNNHKDGYNWAFVGRSNEVLNIAIAKVALPQSTLTNVTNIFDTYSIRNVFEGEIHARYGNIIPQDMINSYLQNTDSPAYFNGIKGFLSCGAIVPTTPVGFTPDFINLTSLKPYIPSIIDDLKINFSPVTQ